MGRGGGGQVVSVLSFYSKFKFRWSQQIFSIIVVEKDKNMGWHNKMSPLILDLNFDLFYFTMT